MKWISSVLFMFMDDRIRETEMECMKVLGTEKRTVVAEIEPIEFNRRVYRNEAGERVKPLDLASGLELYIRRDQCVQEIEIILAARSDLRNTAMICTRITGAKVSPVSIVALAAVFTLFPTEITICPGRNDQRVSGCYNFLLSTKRMIE